MWSITIIDLKKIYFVFIYLICFLLSFYTNSYAVMNNSPMAPSIVEYTHYPVLQSDQVPPNVMVLLDNSGSMGFSCAYPGSYNATHEYYGYFTSTARYKYENGMFVRDSNGDWSGNFLNWLTMRRVDVARLALVGGRAEHRDGSGVTILDGYSYNRTWDNTELYKIDPGIAGLNPYASTNYYYGTYRGVIYVYTIYSVKSIASYNIRVKKDSSYPDEAINFVNGNYAGIIQKIGNRVRWGNAWFNYGLGLHQNGAYIANPIGTPINQIVYDLSNHSCDTWTPLAESYYTIMHYFEQQPLNATVAAFYPDQTSMCMCNCKTQSEDPYYIDGKSAPCIKSFVIIVTDGDSTKDIHVPQFLQDYDQDGNDTIRVNDPNNDPELTSDMCSSDYLDDIALYAHTVDLRPDLPGNQTLTLFTIYAFGDDLSGRQLLEDAAKNGGFIDQNDNKIPDLQSEWDSNGDGIPDNFFSAAEGSALQDDLFKAFSNILQQASSGTSVAILSSRGNGEGFICQAYYRSSYPVSGNIVNWLGFLRSFWVDSKGNLREDSNGDHILEIDQDKIIKFFVDASGNTEVKVYNVNATNPYPNLDTHPYTVKSIDSIIPIWNAGKLLQKRDPSTRRIFTYIGPTDISDNTTYLNDNPFDSTGDVVSFDTSNESLLEPYLGVFFCKYNYLGANETTRATNLIKYIRGYDGSKLSGKINVRSREIPEDNGTLATWKLGDIIHSAPVVVGAPPDRFDFIYHDQSYYAYYQHYRNRENVVYVGANDGMLHAFSAGRINATSTVTQYLEVNGTKLGSELWAFIPEDLLPHLKWLADPGYTHVDYVDLTPKVFDAKIFTPDSVHINGWGTVLVCGLRFGGKFIWTYKCMNKSPAHNFYPCYFAIDVTDPRNPHLLWERTIPPQKNANSIFTTSFPSVVKVKNKWYLVFGTGPTDYDGLSNITAGVYILDLKTGKSVSGDSPIFKALESNSFFNGPIALDKNLNYNVDAIYLGEDYYDNSTNEDKGKIYKIYIPAINATTGLYDPSNTINYSDTPINSSNSNLNWRFACIFNAPGPLTAPLAISIDPKNRVWIYGGTGRYYNTYDKSDLSNEYLFGFKDPFYDMVKAAYNDNATYFEQLPVYVNGLPSSTYLVNYTSLFNATNYSVFANWSVNGTNVSGNFTGNFYSLLSAVDNTWGWIRALDLQGERSLVKPILFGGTLLYTTFKPNSDICSFGGHSYLYGLYYLTGTAYPKPVFEENVPTTPTGVVPYKLDLGEGLASKPAIHMGKSTTTAFIQQSNGEIMNVKIHPAHNTRSGLTSWVDRSIIK